MNLTTLLMNSAEGAEKYIPQMTSDVDMGTKIAFGLEKVAIGMGVVFGVLLILIGILQLFKLFAVKKPAEQTKEKPASVATAPAAPAPSANVPSSEEETIVAVASAAIAATRGESESAFNIISIKKIVK